MEKSVERGRFAFWRTIICPSFTFEWRDRGRNPSNSAKDRAVLLYQPQTIHLLLQTVSERHEQFSKLAENLIVNRLSGLQTISYNMIENTNLIKGIIPLKSENCPTI